MQMRGASAFERDEDAAGMHLAVIPHLPVPRSENIVLPASARISMRRRSTGHMMVAVSRQELSKTKCHVACVPCTLTLLHSFLHCHACLRH